MPHPCLTYRGGNGCIIRCASNITDVWTKRPKTISAFRISLNPHPQLCLNHKSKYLILVLLFALRFHISSYAQMQEIATEQELMEERVKATLKENGQTIRFLENKGQINNSEVLCYFEEGSNAVYIERDRIRFVVLKDTLEAEDEEESHAEHEAYEEEKERLIQGAHTFSLYFNGSNPTPLATGSTPYDTDGFQNIISGFNGGPDDLPHVANIYRISSSIADLLDLTFYGPGTVVSSNNTIAYALGLSDNNVFIGAETNVALPSPGTPLDNTLESSDGFVALFSKNRSTLLYAMYMGGSGPLSYKWQQGPTGTSGWTNAIGTGPTTDMYTPPSTTSGSMYYPVIINSN